jgi:hypothetical protein
MECILTEVFFALRNFTQTFVRHLIRVMVFYLIVLILLTEKDTIFF